MRNAHARSIFGPAARQGGLRSAAVALIAVIIGVAVPAPIAAAAKPPSTTVYVSLSGEPHTPLGWWDLSSCERPDVVGGVAAIEAVIDEAESPTTIYLCDGEYDASSTIDVGSKEGITLEGSRDAILNVKADSKATRPTPAVRSTHHLLKRATANSLRIQRMEMVVQSMQIPNTWDTAISMLAIKPTIVEEQ